MARRNGSSAGAERRITWPRKRKSITVSKAAPISKRFSVVLKRIDACSAFPRARTRANTGITDASMALLNTCAIMIGSAEATK